MFNMYDWQAYNQNNSNTVTQTEPAIVFSIGGTPVFTIKSSGLQYNQEKFPNDTYQLAASRTFEALRGSLNKDGTLSIRLNAYKEHPERHFEITKDGIEHSYSTDTWHWWLLQNLEELCKAYRA